MEWMIFQNPYRVFTSGRIAVPNFKTFRDNEENGIEDAVERHYSPSNYCSWN